MMGNCAGKESAAIFGRLVFRIGIDFASPGHLPSRLWSLTLRLSLNHDFVSGNFDLNDLCRVPNDPFPPRDVSMETLGKCGTCGPLMVRGWSNDRKLSSALQVQFLRFFCGLQAVGALVFILTGLSKEFPTYVMLHAVSAFPFYIYFNKLDVLLGLD